MNGDWIRIGHDFGLSYVTFNVSQRELVICRRVLQIAQAHADTPEGMAAELEALVTHFRPGLAGGQVVCLRMGWGGMAFTFDFTHPSLPRVKSLSGNAHREIMLQPCASCRKDMERGDEIFIHQDQSAGSASLCCSQACAEAPMGLVRVGKAGDQWSVIGMDPLTPAPAGATTERHGGGR